MRNSLKVAKWEYKRNMKNKSFIISLFLTPVLFLVFFNLPLLFDNDQAEEEGSQIYVYDELTVWSSLKSQLPEETTENWHEIDTYMTEDEIMQKLNEAENTAYIMLTDQVLENGSVKVYISDDLDENFVYQTNILEQPLLAQRLADLGLTQEEAQISASGIGFETVTPESIDKAQSEGSNSANMLERIVPVLFAGVILFSILITGMMIFQSASQEKKEKVAEIVLSSLTPEELMKGKIYGYFGLGITQVAAWVVIILPFLVWRVDVPFLEYLFVPELLLLLFIAIAGYLLFASIFVSIGATVEDMNSSSNFQGMMFMLPFLPAIFFGPIMSDPSGIVAQIGTFFPITTPGVLLIRLALLETWPWVEIIIAIVVLIVSIWVFMKLAGKIFKTGILLYGKDATPKEIWKWIRQ
ncbi:ABC-2 type transport system permease protein [Salinibacillus kushneri]|uniref:ABC-2 type transport system permease protein n=1 Tax=Salinibacillus kushneri TaxID=237682 RepID=A0A1I0CIC1_9BACI|nr:ABC transporter permease [Salinibacillus kushneri]SET19172.1 ABC-2 type transport system permease protein [Salinibacillus kushneri]